MVRAPACHAGGRRFEPVWGRQIFLKRLSALNALVAQMVERWTENPYVGGSIPPQGTTLTGGFAGVAQLAEQLICNQQVVGSIPITSSNYPVSAG